MKKTVLFLLLALVIALPAKAAVAPPVVVAGAEADGIANFWMFTGALGFGLMVEYLNAEGVPFPLCGVNGWTCTQEYPTAVHRDGV